MSYANGTQFYNLPQTVGTDKRDWFDTNGAFAAVDAALHAAATGQAADAEAIATINTSLASAESDIAALQTASTSQASDISALQATVATQGTAITDVRQDAEDMISAFNEGAASVSTHAYAIGDYFIYNDVLYKATAAIAIGATIVPNTNCSATNVTSEIKVINADIDDVKSDLTYSTDTILASNNANLLHDVLVKRFGKVVSIRFRGVKNLGTASSETLFTLPTEYRPSDVEWFSVIDNSGVEKYLFNVDTNGVVSVASATTANNQDQARGTFTFIK